MAHGIHWEWRGIGQVSQAFRSRFRSLEPFLPTHTLVDDYLWAPGLAVNIKLRREAEGRGALKFKRRIGREGELEQWSERPEDIHPFPLDLSAWRALTEAFGSTLADIPTPADPVGKAHVLSLLSSRVPGLRVIRVVKRRSVRIRSSPSGGILVELADISGPRTVHSVGLECRPASGLVQADGDWEPQALRQAMTALGIDAERLTAMSYLAAIELWARSDRSTDR